MSARAFLVMAAVGAMALAACEGDPCPDCGGDGGGGEGGDASAIPCPEGGVLHGPWALHFDETHASVRWDACRPSSTRIILTPEEGGDSETIEGTQLSSEVTTSYQVINGVPPDVPGTYYRTEVELAGLTAGTCYRYELEADASRSGRFCTARAAGESFRFMAIGDTNPAIGDTGGVLEHALAEKPDFSIHLGDLQYYASVFESWAVWFPAMRPLLRGGAFLPSLGNHEYENPTEFVDYYERLFGGAGFDGPVEHYRFQSGGLWFFSMSTELDMGPGSAQATWLEAQLADASARPGYRGAVVYFHKPFITLAGYSQDKAAREHFRPIFEQRGVRLVMQGHVHGYERFVDGSLTYITSGGGGALLHDLDERAADRPDEAAMRQASASSYHAMVIDVGPTGMSGRAISHEGEVLDTFDVALP